MMASSRLVTGLVLLGASMAALLAQKQTLPAIYTSAQSDAGRAAYEETCGRCHTLAMTGRKGSPGELPPLETLSEADRDFIAKYGPVPALAGKDLISRWKTRTAAELIARIDEAVGAFPPGGKNEKTAVEITAYALRMSGARAGNQQLTRSSKATVGSLAE